jgi:hypothetical protein
MNTTNTTIPAKRKWRFVSYAATGMLAVLLVASCALWVRSYWVNDFAFYGAARPAPKVCEQWGVVSNRGICRLGWQAGDLQVITGWNYNRGETFAWANLTSFWKRAGFNYEAKDNFQFAGKHCDYRIVAIPYWLLAGVFALSIAIPNRKSARVQRVFERFASF